MSTIMMTEKEQWGEREAQVARIRTRSGPANQPVPQEASSIEN